MHGPYTITYVPIKMRKLMRIFDAKLLLIIIGTSESNHGRFSLTISLIS